MLRRTFAAAAVGWAASLPLATWIAGGVHPLSLSYTAAATIYGIGAWICHQHADRSFYLWAMQMPVCARCTGIYLGGALAAVPWCIAIARRRASAASTCSARQWRLVFAIAALPTLVTLAAEWSGIAAMSNAVRAIAGIPIGAVIVWIVLRAEVN